MRNDKWYDIVIPLLVVVVGALSIVWLIATVVASNAQ